MRRRAINQTITEIAETIFGPRLRELQLAVDQIQEQNLEELQDSLELVQIVWEGGAVTDDALKLPKPSGHAATDPDTLDLVRRLAADYPDHQIAGILARQGRLTGAGNPFTADRVRSLRSHHKIPSAAARTANALGLARQTVPHKGLRRTPGDDHTCVRGDLDADLPGLVRRGLASTRLDRSVGKDESSTLRATCFERVRTSAGTGARPWNCRGLRVADRGREAAGSVRADHAPH